MRVSCRSSAEQTTVSSFSLLKQSYSICHLVSVWTKPLFPFLNRRHMSRTGPCSSCNLSSLSSLSDYSRDPPFSAQSLRCLGWSWNGGLDAISWLEGKTSMIRYHAATIPTYQGPSAREDLPSPELPGSVRLLDIKLGRREHAMFNNSLRADL